MASAVFAQDGRVISRRPDRSSHDGDVGDVILSQIDALLDQSGADIRAVGVSVPGIYYADRGTVWAPNIPGWTDYPLGSRIRENFGERVSVRVDSDRACYILGEAWKGRAAGCRNAIFVAVGTGIGAGILVDGHLLRGIGDAAGAIGWMALNRPYLSEYDDCGCFEYHASGAGIGKVARKLLASNAGYEGVLRSKAVADLTAVDIFKAEQAGDPIARQVLAESITFWGMAVANLVSLFNPEMIILGGGVFESAARFLPRIREEAECWAQPISVKQVAIETSLLGADAGLYGAARLALDEVG